MCPGISSRTLVVYLAHVFRDFVIFLPGSFKLMTVEETCFLNSQTSHVPRSVGWTWGPSWLLRMEQHLVTLSHEAVVHVSCLAGKNVLQNLLFPSSPGWVTL